MREATRNPAAGAADAAATVLPPAAIDALTTLDEGALADAHALSATLADHARATVSTTPGPSGEEVSIAVTLEHPGRYRGPRKDGAGPIEIGRGGIGRVLIAHDAHLGREVAVKELLSRPDERSGSKSSTNPRESLIAARFLREARLTGQLEHPNIVPVYELGRRPDGTLYYTMKVVRGKDLATAFEAVKNHGLRARMRLLKHYADLCDAIAYAHSRGVVHRDIKPENVMVGEFGETVVLDWGLAKPRHARDLHDTQPDAPAPAQADTATIPPDDAQLRGPVPRSPGNRRGITTSDDGKEEDLAATADGTLLGTPLYMSPEQAQGDLAQIDERSDVWSLGVMLYEILTGEPPFWAKTAVELLIKIVRGDFEKTLHRCPEAPPELAAIAEKALSKDPANRYRDAREMAEEVRAYLTGGRVQAYNYGVWTLIKRWAARHKPALVVASLAVVALITLGVLSFRSIAIERDRAMDAHAQAVTAMNEAKAEKARAESAERAATQARDSAEHLIRYMLSDLKERLEPLGQLAVLDDVADAIQSHYEAGDVEAEAFGRPATVDYAHQRNRAAVTALMGDLKRTRGDLIGAAKDYALARALRDQLLADAPTDPQRRMDHAESLRHEGLLARAQGDLEAAKASFASARKTRSELFAQAPDDFEFRRAYVESELDRGEIASLTGDLRLAETAFTSAVELARGLATVADSTYPEGALERSRARYDLAVALDGLGTSRLDMAQVGPARQNFEEAFALRKALLDKFPSNSEWRHRLAISNARLGEVAELEGRPDDARTFWQKASGIMERLVRHDPDNARWARDLAIDTTRLGDLLLDKGDHAAALKSFEKALDPLTSLADKDPSNAEAQRDLEIGLNRLGDAALVAKRLDDAQKAYRKGLDVAEKLAALDASNTRWQHDLALSLGKVAFSLAKGGDLTTSRPLAERAEALLKALVQKDATNAAWTRDLTRANNLVSAIANGGQGLDANDPPQDANPGRQHIRTEDAKTAEPGRQPVKDLLAEPGRQPQRPSAMPTKQPVRPATGGGIDEPPAPKPKDPKDPKSSPDNPF